MEGRFTRLFPYLPSARFAQHDLERLAHEMTAPKDTDADTEPDPEENPGIPAAYTYLGQFVDHDLTFDPISHLRATLTGAQLRALVDFRTPRFDLDNLYGRGPDDQPYMYRKDGIRMLLGESMSGKPFDPGAVQLPRGPSGRALIGDPRNDENRIVAQLHAVFLRFHNRVVQKMGGNEPRQFPGSPRAGPMALPVDPGQRLPAQDPGRADVPERLPGPLRACARDSEAPGERSGAHAGGVLGSRLPFRALHDPTAVQTQPGNRASDLLQFPVRR